MGFFQDLKEDLFLAVNELFPEEEGAANQTAAEQLPEEEGADNQAAAEQLPQEDADVDETMKELQAALTAEFVEKPQVQSEKSKTDSLMDVAASQLANIAGIVKRENTTTGSQSATVTDETEKREQTLPEEMPADFVLSENAVLMQEKKEETALEKEVKIAADKQQMNIAGEPGADEAANISAERQIIGDIVLKGSITVEGNVWGNIEILGKLIVNSKAEGDARAAQILADSAHIMGAIPAGEP